MTLFGKAEHVPQEGICTAVREGETIRDVECFGNTVDAAARFWPRYRTGFFTAPAAYTLR